MGKRIIAQRRGKGSTTYRSPGFRSKGKPANYPLSAEVLNGKVVDFIKCPLHSAPLMTVQYDSGEKGMLIAPENVKVGDVFSVGGNDVTTANCLALKNIPEGTYVYNLEIRPGDGGKFVKATGTFARVFSRLKDKVIVILPSKKKKTFLPECRANIGVVSGGGRVDKPILKAGNAFYKYKAKNKLWPKTSGHSMNAVDHPFGNKRSSRKSKAKPAPRDAPPGRKVGMIRPRRTGRKKR